jgi:hypothetical protein
MWPAVEGLDSNVRAGIKIVVLMSTLVVGDDHDQPSSTRYVKCA